MRIIPPKEKYLLSSIFGMLLLILSLVTCFAHSHSKCIRDGKLIEIGIGNLLESP